MNTDPAATVSAVAAGLPDTQRDSCPPASNVSTSGSGWLDRRSATSPVRRPYSRQPLGPSIAVAQPSSMRTVRAAHSGVADLPESMLATAAVHRHAAWCTRRADVDSNETTNRYEGT